ncbi:hypothetical protein SLS62_007481 [Diatrype stigma]|uniref:asparaginase n=1 Tax=Diatrype stigma TaxID=117547 RepID=A0AAN9YQR2_9PEZI
MEPERLHLGSCRQPGRPNVTIFGTGGTIASQAKTTTALSGYQANLSIQSLVDSVSELLDVANLWGIQVSNILSKDMSAAIALQLSKAVNAELSRPDVDGVVVTHGTDTLEETAFLLDLTIQSDKPVVFVGSMRPASALSADGPMNLFQAVILAASKEARGRGTLIAMNNRIGAAWNTNKNHANAPDSFYSVDEGQVGFFVSQRPTFYFGPSLPLGRTVFDVSACPALPQVDIMFGHQDWNVELIRASAATGARGIVFNNVGDGSWSESAKGVAHEVFREKGIPMVYSRRAHSGYAVQRDDDEWAIASGPLPPQKARILLQLTIQAGHDFEEIKEIFTRTWGGAR